MAIDEARFRQAMGYFATGVTVVTTESDGVWYGMTVNAFSSVSLRPPLVLICVGKEVATHDAIVRSKRFAVNILSEEQEEISRRFASKRDDKFVGVGAKVVDPGLPALDDAACVILCRLYETLEGGDHTIFLGEVVEATVRDDLAPLVYFRSGYRKLAV